MPASSSEARTRWKKRRREPLISRKSKAPQHSQDDDVMEDDDDDEEEFNDDDHATDGNAISLPAPDRAVQVKESELVSQGGDQISSFPLVVKQRVIRPHSSVVSVAAMELACHLGDSPGIGQNTLLLENISHGQLQVSSAVPADSLPSGAGAGAAEESGCGSVVISPPPIMKGSGVVKRFGSAGRIHVLPMHSDWFSPYTVHRLERQVVPHFFSGKSADLVPEKYMECRNCIVAKYMENPEKYLSLDDCQGLVTDVSHDDLARIVRFLDHWGIINYCAAPLNFDPRKDTTLLCEDSNGDLCVPTATLKSIDSLIKFDKPKCKLKAADIYPDLASRSGEDPDFDNIIRENFSEARCNYCSHPTPAVYYQSQKEVDALLCLDCYHDGRFVVGHSSLDFVKVNSMKGYSGLEGESWTDEETLLLLEGMQLYNENWNKVAEHVGTKSKAQCILHFVRLPLDGSSLENVEVPSSGIQSNLQNGDDHGVSHSKANGNSTGFKGQDSDCKSEFPFASCGNPVMALVAFLASAVGPRVAAACAHASLAALSKEDVSTSSLTSVQKDGPRSSTEGLHFQEGGPHGDHASSSLQKDEKLRAQGPRNPNELEATPLNAEQVMAAAKVGLGAAATKAKLFADHEEREIQRLSANIINHRLKRLELKLKQFAEVETLLMRECEQMERGRQRIGAERSLMLSHIGSAGFPSRMGPPNMGPAVNRQQLLSNSLSGFGGNHQQMPSHMSLMSQQQQQQQQQQQSMYGLGQRLPLSAIQQPSPSASASSIMLGGGGAANSPPQGFGHPTPRPALSGGSKSGLV